MDRPLLEMITQTFGKARRYLIGAERQDLTENRRCGQIRGRNPNTAAMTRPICEPFVACR